MALMWTAIALCVGLCHGVQVADSDSLQGALEAINRRQHDLQDPTLYYLKHFHPPKDRSSHHMPHQPADDDGQPEDIGYGYQKSLAPKTAGYFEDTSLPDDELGSHDPGVESLTSADKNELENIILDYFSGKVGIPEATKMSGYNLINHSSDKKRSVFRERDIHIPPEILQNLVTDNFQGNSYLENGEHPKLMPSLFRERTPQKSTQHKPNRNVQALVRSFGGLNRDTENIPENVDDSDEYLSMLNSVWEKYQDSNPDHLDPENLSEKDVEEIMGYINSKEERKRQQKSTNDFYNSPLAWVKRASLLSTSDFTKSTSDQYFNTLKYLSGPEDNLELLSRDNMPDYERDLDVAKLLLDEHKGSKNKKRYVKRYWRGNTNKDYNIAKRFTVTKRSLPYYSSPTLLYHKRSGINKFNQRRKKNIKLDASDSVTDPKTAQELNYIFSAKENMSEGTKLGNSTDKTHFLQHYLKNSTNTTKYDDPIISKPNSSQNIVKINLDHVQGTQAHSKHLGQKEETNIDSQHKELGISKKSVNWNDYFGIDKRQKKSKGEDDGWLLNQYLKAYSVSARAIKNYDGDNKKSSSFLEIDKRSTDDIDGKLRAMEDKIIDQAVKFTGAHEGMSDSDEVQAVKDRVIAQLAAAYSLEKMRKALSEFKTSMADQRDSVPTHMKTNSLNDDTTEQKDKRVAIKKEKDDVVPQEARIDNKEDSESSNEVLNYSGLSKSALRDEDESCPTAKNLMQKCLEIAYKAMDYSNTLVPLCYSHQFCYICGHKMGEGMCDLTFSREAFSLCGDTTHCEYTIYHTMVGMQSLLGDHFPISCDNNCLAHYYSMFKR